MLHEPLAQGPRSSMEKKKKSYCFGKFWGLPGKLHGTLEAEAAASVPPTLSRSDPAAFEAQVPVVF